jgi:hypothetical protein
MWLRDRLTPLAEGESALADWMNMFASSLLDDLSAGERAQVLARASQLARPALFIDGRWWVDHRRLRFEAVRPG